MGFEPRVLAFMCNWCCYAAADGAGVGRQNYPPYHRVIRVMCSTRVDPLFVFKGYLNGADAVLVGGCHLGDCKYVIGNYYTVVLKYVIKAIMNIIGMKKERFIIEWASAAEGSKLAEDLTNYFNKLKELGPLGEKEGWSEKDKKLYLSSCIKLAEDRQFRTIYGNICKELRKLGDFSEKNIIERVNEKLSKVIKSKLYEFEVKELLKDGPKSIDFLCKKTKADPDELKKILSKVVKT